MVQQITDYLANRPAATEPVSTSDRTLIIQSGTLREIDPRHTATPFVIGTEGVEPLADAIEALPLIFSDVVSFDHPVTAPNLTANNATQMASNIAELGQHAEDITANSAAIAALQIGQSSGVVAYATRAALFADLAHSANSKGYVGSDSTAAYNGDYYKLGASGTGSWVQSSFDRVTILENIVVPLDRIAFDTGPPVSRTVEAVQDHSGAFVAGTRPDGSRPRWNNPSAKRVQSQIVRGSSQIFVSDGLGTSQLTFTGNNTSPEIMQDKILFTSDRRGTTEPYFMGMDGSNQTPAASLVYQHWQVVGQSLSIGTNSGAVLTSSNADSRAFMMELSVTGVYGPRPNLDADPGSTDSPCDASKFTGITELVESLRGTNGETVCSGFAAQYLHGSPSSARMVIDCHGLGATPYRAPSSGASRLLCPGSNQFSNGMIIQDAVKGYVMGGGDAYLFAGLLNIHGESDASNGRSRADYLADLIDWATSYNRQSRHDSHLHRLQPMFVSQLGSNLRWGGNTLQQGLDIALAQMDAHDLNANIWLTGPRYQFPTADGTHLTAAGYRQLGELMGKVVRRVMNGEAWQPLRPLSWVKNGANVDITFSVASQLVFDTSVVSDPGHGGFTYVDDSASGVTVVSATITGPDTVRLVLSNSVLGTNPRFRIAANQTGTDGGPTAGSRSTLRDSDPETGILSGLPLYNYACTFEGAL